MTDCRQLCTELGIDENLARDFLLREHKEPGSALATNWYVRLVVGFGAWVTAIAVISLGVAIISLIEPRHPMVVMIVLGFVYLATGLSLLRITSGGIFTAQLGAAIAAAGVALSMFGSFAEWSRSWPAFMLGLAATAIIIMTTPNRTLQFLAALLTAVFFTSTLVDSEIPYFLAVAALAGALGVLLFLRPPERDLHALGIVLLLVFPIFDLLYGTAASIGLYEQTIEAGSWLAKSLGIALFLSLAAIHWKRTNTGKVRTRLIVFAAVAIIVSMLLPPGGAAALTVMMLAFVLGSRPLALLGTLLQASYIWRFYYDMDVSLLVKSEVLMAAGAALVLAWWLMTRRSRGGLRS